MQTTQTMIRNGEMKSVKSSHSLLEDKGKGKVHPCTGTDALYRPYGT